MFVLNNPWSVPTISGDSIGVRPAARVDEESFMLDYDERIGRPEKRRVRGANRDRAAAHVRRVPIAVSAPNERRSIMDEHADNLACDLLMERLDASVDCRFVPEIV
jgi:hypothetical protein